MADDRDLILHRDVVDQAWVDYNGHMNVAYYVLVFDRATDALLDALGLGEAYLERRNCSTFALEAHTCYKREMTLGDPIRVESQLIAADHKRIHYFHRMFHDDKDHVTATHEQISIHVDLSERRSASFAEAERQRIGALLSAHERLERPAELGSRIAIPAPREA